MSYRFLLFQFPCPFIPQFLITLIIVSEKQFNIPPHIFQLIKLRFLIADLTLQLLVLSNMESYNAVLINQGKPQAERIKLLHDLAVQQMSTLNKLELNNLPETEQKNDTQLIPVCY